MILQNARNSAKGSGETRKNCRPRLGLVVTPERINCKEQVLLDHRSRSGNPTDLPQPEAVWWGPWRFAASTELQGRPSFNQHSRCSPSKRPKGKQEKLTLGSLNPPQSSQQAHVPPGKLLRPFSERPVSPSVSPKTSCFFCGKPKSCIPPRKLLNKKARLSLPKNVGPIKKPLWPS